MSWYLLFQKKINTIGIILHLFVQDFCLFLNQTLLLSRVDVSSLALLNLLFFLSF